MKPILNYFKKFFASNRILGNDTRLAGMAKADAILTQLITEKRVPGLGISVLKQGKVIYQRGYGHSDVSTKTPVDPRSTIFRIASISKPITATALAIMCTEGIIDLDASFYNYVPYYPKKKHDFSIRQLASHTAGIRGYRGKEYALNKAYSIKDSIEIFKDDPLLFVPGEQYLYNSYGWVLISLAMQEASGIAFEDYVKSRVLEPLQMLHTQPEIPHALPANLANFYTGYSSGFKKATSVDNRYKLAGGGYLSTCEDIARLGQAYLDGKVLDHLTRKEFLSPIYYNETPTWYGLGWEVSEDGFGRPFYGHTGNGIGVHSRFYVYPEEQMVFSILVNCTSPPIKTALDVVIDTLLRAEISKV